jgi:hypothetical protein
MCGCVCAWYCTAFKFHVVGVLQRRGRSWCEVAEDAHRLVEARIVLRPVALQFDLARVYPPSSRPSLLQTHHRRLLQP